MLQRDGEIAAPASIFRHQDTVQQHRRLVRQLRLIIVRANKLRVRTCTVSVHMTMTMTMRLGKSTHVCLPIVCAQGVRQGEWKA